MNTKTKIKIKIKNQKSNPKTEKIKQIFQKIALVNRTEKLRFGRFENLVNQTKIIL